LIRTTIADNRDAIKGRRHGEDIFQRQQESVARREERQGKTVFAAIEGI
jgi:hypothetical protein